MERFYQLLRSYNIQFTQTNNDLPEWFCQYTENEPPLYWKTVYQILKDVDKDLSVVEIGGGYGDITALLYFMGYRNIISFEKDVKLCSIIEEKIKTLFRNVPIVRKEQYPVEIGFTPDILIQVNCVYTGNLQSKEEYLGQIKHYYKINGTPKMYLLEVIDDSYIEKNDIFPYYVRLNKADIEMLFPCCKISDFKTYQFPVNKTSKTLYCICK
jgi:hypothetical protein